MIPGYTHYCHGCGAECRVVNGWNGKKSLCCGFTVRIGKQR